MKIPSLIYFLLFFTYCAVSPFTVDGASHAEPSKVETIVLIRHGEKPSDSLGQLNCRGLNRSLALPHVLLSRFGRPNFVFAPNPSVMSTSASGRYSYVRALATIEPTAIKAHLPVNTQIGLGNVKGLEKELTKARYSNAMIFVAWEHSYLDIFAKKIVKDRGGDPSLVPAWPEDDYDSIFVIRLRSQDKHTSVSFAHEYQGLTGHLSDTCPGYPGTGK